MTKQKFAAFDIDGTLFRSGLQREVFYELTKMGIVPQSLIDESTVKFREWRHRVHGNAFEEFDMFMVSVLDQTLPNLKVSDYTRAAEQVIAKRAENVYVYTRELLKSLKAEDYFLLAISGSQQHLVEPFAIKYGFDAWVGQEWEMDKTKDYFTGKRTYTHTGKDKILESVMDRYNLTMDDSYAIGDSGGDIGILRIVDHPIAFNPTFELLEVAIEREWKIVIERKNTSIELRKEPTIGHYILEKTNRQ